MTLPNSIYDSQEYYALLTVYQAELKQAQIDYAEKMLDIKTNAAIEFNRLAKDELWRWHSAMPDYIPMPRLTLWDMLRGLFRA